MITFPAHRGLVRLLGGVTTVAGAALIIWPRTLAGRLSGGHPPAKSIILRILGARQVLQGTAQIASPTTDLVLAGITADAIHAASMVAVAALSPRYRLAAAVSASAAVLSAGAGAAILLGDRE